MTVESTTPRVVAATNGATTVFPVPFYFLADADLVVKKTDTSSNAVADLVLNSDYTVAGAGAPAGGSITISPALASGFSITVYRDPTVEQQLDLVANDALPAEPLEQALDRLTMFSQRSRDLLDRSFRLDDGDVSGASTSIPTPQSSTVIGWNSAGDALENKNLPAGTAVYTSIANTRTGTATSEAVTPDSLASLWQEGAALTAAASISKPIDTSLGGSYTVGGNTGTNTFWAGDKDGDKMWHRYTGTPLLGTSGNLVPPGGAAFQVIAGDMILWKWDAGATKWRAYTGMRADGTALVVASVARPPVPVRQTVLSGPVDANGLPNFGGSTASTTVTVVGTLVATAANGEDVNGQIDRVGSKANPSWTGLSTNGTMYLYVTVNADGTLTEGSTTLAPNYQFGGTYSTTSGQFTFNIQEMVGKVGNGSVANQTYRVFVGEVTVAGAVVTAITWYALKGNYVSAFTATLPGVSTSVSFNHNIGTRELYGARYLEVECTTTDNGYAVGDRRTEFLGEDNSGAHAAIAPVITSRLAAQISTQTINTFLVQAKAGGAAANLVAADWKYRMIVQRGW